MAWHELTDLISLGYSKHISRQTKLEYVLRIKGIGELELSIGAIAVIGTYGCLKNLRLAT